jgi:hypothetical protein
VDIRPAVFLFLLSTATHAEAGVSPLSIDASASGLIPVTWASDSPTLSHLGFDALFGIEYDSPISIPLRLEVGYISVGPSLIAPTGELYRAWEGGRFALLSGYSFAPFSVGKLGMLDVSLLAGAALTAADYTGTPLAYAYPSLVLEPRLALKLRTLRARAPVQGPWLALPFELMFRAGNHTLSSGLSLGWSYGIPEHR